MGTIQSAVSLLMTEGLLHSDDRRGTFVLPSPETLAAQPRPHSGTSFAPSPVLAASATLGILTHFGDDAHQISEIHTQWQYSILHRMEQVFAQANGTSRFVNCYQAPTQTFTPIHEAVRLLLSQEVSALAVVLLHDAPDEVNNVLQAIGAWPTPIVFVGSNALHRPIPHVYYDNFYAGYQAVQHLIGRGYRDLVFIAPTLADWAEARLAGVRQGLQDAGLAESALRVVPARRVPDPEGLHYESEAYAAARALFEMGQSLFGVIAVNDRVAYGFLKAAREVGQVPGEDFGILGFDDDTRSRELALTTLRPPLEEMGEAAARLLLSALGGQETTMRVSLRSHLLPRASTRAARSS